MSEKKLQNGGYLQSDINCYYSAYQLYFEYVMLM